MAHLKVVFPPELGAKDRERTVTVQNTSTVREIIESAVKGVEGLCAPDQYALVLQTTKPNSRDAATEWLSPTKTLQDIGLGSATAGKDPKKDKKKKDKKKKEDETEQDGEKVLQLRRAFVVLKTTAYDGSNFSMLRILYPLQKPLNEWVTYVCHKFGISNSNEYSLFSESSHSVPLTMEKCLLELPTIDVFKKDTGLLLRNPSASFDLTGMKIYQDLHERDLLQKLGHPPPPKVLPGMRNIEKTAAEKKEGAGGENPEGAAAEISAPELLLSEPDVNGFLNRMNKKKKFDRWFCILVNRQLYQYKGQNDPKPSAVISLKQFSVRPFDDKKKKITDAIEVYNEADKKAEPIIFKADNAMWRKQWLDGFEKNCKKEGEVVTDDKPKQLAKTVSEAKGAGDPTKKIFGVPLDEVIKKQKGGGELPNIVTQCVAYIDERGLEAEGIFRLSGSSTLIEELKAAYDRGEEPDLSQEQDPHAISGLMKLFFREMPEPLLTWERYSKFILADAVQNKALRLSFMKHLLNTLPAPNKNLLKFLTAFLIRVESHSNVNKMYTHNLATVFGPNLLKQEGANMLQMVEHTPQINSIVATLIKYYEFFFESQDMPDDVDDTFPVLGAKAMYDYTGTPGQTDDLLFSKNDVLNVIVQGQDGWWIGERDSQFGKFPGSYVKIMTADQKVKSERRDRFFKEMAQLNKKHANYEVAIKELEAKKADLEAECKELRAKEAGSLSKAATITAKLKTGVTPSLQSNLNDVTTNISKIKENEKKAEPLRSRLQAEIDVVLEVIADYDKSKKKDKNQEKLNLQVKQAAECMRGRLDAEAESRRKFDRAWYPAKNDLDGLQLFVRLASESK